MCRNSTIRVIWKRDRNTDEGTGTDSMKIQDFEQIVKTEKVAARYLGELCMRSGPLRCLSCGCKKLYSIEAGKRKRCSNCGYTFHIFTGRWINRNRISFRNWLWILKLFELETSASVIADETGISYPTVLKAVTSIRMAIAHFGNRHLTSVFERNVDSEIIGVIGNGFGSRLEPVPRELILRSSKIVDNHLILLDRTALYDSLVCCSESIRLVNKGMNFPRCRVYCSVQGFWPYAKEKLIKFHGVSDARLPLYMNEIEFRWTNRNNGIFDMLAEKLCSYVHEGPARRYAATCSPL